MPEFRLKNLGSAIFVLTVFFWPYETRAVTADNFLGRLIRSNIEKNKIWFVGQADKKKRPANLLSEVRDLAEKSSLLPLRDFQVIAQADMPIPGNAAIAKKYAGRFWKLECSDEVWYVNPLNLKRYPVNSEEEFLFLKKEAKEIGLGDMAKIHKSGFDESVDQYSRYERQTIKTKGGQFTVDLITIDLANPNLKVITDTTETSNLAPRKDKGQKIFSAKPLANFAAEHKAFAAVNGSYFCSNDGCREKNYFFYPVYSTKTGKIINDDQLKYWTTGPVLAFDDKNNFYYFKDSRDFKSALVLGADKTYYLKTNGGQVKLQAAIGNKPRLIQDYMNYLIDWEMDKKQMTTKALRSAIGYRDGKIYLIMAKNSTVFDLADIMQNFKVEYALNLDGGYSSAMLYNEEYMVGPGRDIPNAILFARK